MQYEEKSMQYEEKNMQYEEKNMQYEEKNMQYDEKKLMSNIDSLKVSISKLNFNLEIIMGGILELQSPSKLVMSCLARLTGLLSKEDVHNDVSYLFV
jgi:hypothetical protein